MNKKKGFLFAVVAVVVAAVVCVFENTEKSKTDNIVFRKKNVIISNAYNGHKGGYYSTRNSSQGVIDYDSKIVVHSRGSNQGSRILDLGKSAYKQNVSNGHNGNQGVRRNPMSTITSNSGNYYNMRTGRNTVQNVNVYNGRQLAMVEPFQNQGIDPVAITRIASDPEPPGSPIGDAVLPMLVCAMLFVTFKLYNTKL